jgi:hypothetical protein
MVVDFQRWYREQRDANANPYPLRSCIPFKKILRDTYRTNRFLDAYAGGQKKLQFQ